MLGSHNAKDWQVIHAPSAILEAGQCTHALIAGPWNFIKAQAKSAQADMPSKANVYITMRR